jgi:hypothetical protein
MKTINIFFLILLGSVQYAQAMEREQEISCRKSFSPETIEALKTLSDGYWYLMRFPTTENREKACENAAEDIGDPDDGILYYWVNNRLDMQNVRPEEISPHAVCRYFGKKRK